MYTDSQRQVTESYDEEDTMDVELDAEAVALDRAKRRTVLKYRTQKGEALSANESYNFFAPLPKIMGDVERYKLGEAVLWYPTSRKGLQKTWKKGRIHKVESAYIRVKSKNLQRLVESKRTISTDDAKHRVKRTMTRVRSSNNVVSDAKNAVEAYFATKKKAPHRVSDKSPPRCSGDLDHANKTEKESIAILLRMEQLDRQFNCLDTMIERDIALWSTTTNSEIVNAADRTEKKSVKTSNDQKIEKMRERGDGIDTKVSKSDSHISPKDGDEPATSSITVSSDTALTSCPSPMHKYSALKKKKKKKKMKMMTMMKQKDTTKMIRSEPSEMDLTKNSESIHKAPNSDTVNISDRQTKDEAAFFERDTSTRPHAPCKVKDAAPAVADSATVNGPESLRIEHFSRTNLEEILATSSSQSAYADDCALCMETERIISNPKEMFYHATLGNGGVYDLSAKGFRRRFRVQLWMRNQEMQEAKRMEMSASESDAIEAQNVVKSYLRADVEDGATSDASVRDDDDDDDDEPLHSEPSPLSPKVDPLGEVCFPGGMIDDEDDTVIDAALRELNEEMGIDPDRVDVLGILRCDWGEIQSITGVAVTPVVGFIGDISSIELNFDSGEVEQCFTVPFEEIAKRSQWESGDYSAPVFKGGPEIIWGLTAYVLDRFLHRVLYHHRGNVRVEPREKSAYEKNIRHSDRNIIGD
eukprot:g622.t1